MTTPLIPCSICGAQNNRRQALTCSTRCATQRQRLLRLDPTVSRRPCSKRTLDEQVLHRRARERKRYDDLRSLRAQGAALFAKRPSP